jgi:hypothetical protein
MAKKSIQREEMVMAWGERGLKPTPATEAVGIPVLPLAEGNKSIPATIRLLSHIFATPRRLSGIRTKGLQWPLVTWRDVNGKRASCYVRHVNDARDPLFNSIAESSRARILAAVNGT